MANYNVYLARKGFKDNPISEEEWLSAAKSRDLLSVAHIKNRRGSYWFVSFKFDRRQPINITPFGLIRAPNPSRELVLLMFELGALLGADVYDDDFRPYKSIDDWERRTKDVREIIDREKRSTRIRRIIYICGVVACGMLGVLLARLSE